MQMSLESIHLYLIQVVATGKGSSDSIKDTHVQFCVTFELLDARI